MTLYYGMFCCHPPNFCLYLSIHYNHVCQHSAISTIAKMFIHLASSLGPFLTFGLGLHLYTHNNGYLSIILYFQCVHTGRLALSHASPFPAFQCCLAWQHTKDIFSQMCPLSSLVPEPIPSFSTLQRLSSLAL